MTLLRRRAASAGGLRGLVPGWPAELDYAAGRFANRPFVLRDTINLPRRSGLSV
jgi:hypothetical protein